MKKERTQKKFEEEGIEKKEYTEFFLERKVSGIEIFLGERHRNFGREFKNLQKRRRSFIKNFREIFREQVKGGNRFSDLFLRKQF